MDNAAVLEILGLGLAATGLAVAFQSYAARPVWVVPVLAIVGTVLGLLALLTVAFR